MILTFKVDLGIYNVHLRAKFYEPEFIGLAFRGLKTFCVGALRKQKIKNKKETNQVKIYKAVLKHLPNSY